MHEIEWLRGNVIPGQAKEISRFFGAFFNAGFALWRFDQFEPFAPWANGCSALVFGVVADVEVYAGIMRDKHQVVADGEVAPSDWRDDERIAYEQKCRCFEGGSWRVAFALLVPVEPAE